MKKRILWIGIFCAFLGSGCDDSPAPPIEPKVIRKSIVAIPPEIIRNARVDADEATGNQEMLIAGNTPATSPENGKPSLPESNGETASEGDSVRNIVEESEPFPRPKRETVGLADPAVAVIAAADETEVDDATGESVTSISKIAPDEASDSYIAYARDDRVDPFVPLFKEEPEVEKDTEPTADDGKPKPPPRRLTPLEKLDLSQLKLVGIVRTPKGNKAMVEEASGKGYIIDKGTYIGIHSGQVVEIKKDGIVVEEKDTDQSGKVTVRTREIKFQRPSGDEYYEM